MSLRDSYKTAAPPEAAPVVTAAAPTAPAATPTPAVSGAARRDLSAMRARLAGNGGVNPPEAVAALVDSLADPCTKETPDGGAEMLPNHPDAAKLGPVSTAVAGAEESAAGAAPTKRKRRTKAEMALARAAEYEKEGQALLAAEAASVPSWLISLDETAPSTVAGAKAYIHPLDAPEFQRELAAARAETAGFTILTDEVRKHVVRTWLQELSLEGAINLVQERMFPGMKTLEVER